MDSFLGFIDLVSPVHPVVERTSYFLSVKLQFKDSKIIETVNFQSLNVFKFLEDDVDIILWKHIRNDGEVISEGTSIEALESHLNNFKEE